MTDWIQEILQRFGQTVTVRTQEEDVTAKAFVQPVTRREEQLPGAMTGIGTVDERLWSYMGRTGLCAEDRVLWNNMEFRVRSSRPYHIGEVTVYWWASLEREKEAAE